MSVSAKGILFSVLGGFWAILELANPAFGQTGRSPQASAGAVVTIGITVGPIAEIVFPEGQAFELRVPEPSQAGALQEVQHQGFQPASAAPVHMAELPFIVRGNATAVVEAQPSETTWTDDQEFGVARSARPNDGVSLLAYSMEIDFGDRPSNMFLQRAHTRSSGPAATAGVFSSSNVAQSPERGILRIVGNAMVFGTGPGEFTGEIVVSVSAEL
ncbi:MAG: hypothetical protein EA424_07840 [Planctomycetaceae bacterium]|nr:MAG: hypothetical protein EA424_07840 [Planctomycetaceae bacterium]